MILRRAIAVLLTLALSHLMVAGDVAVCSDAAGHAAPDAERTAAVGHVHGTGTQADSDDTPADASVPSQCCSAMTTCAITLIAAAATARTKSAADVRGTSDITQRTPASKVRAPDPPPPKA